MIIALNGSGGGWPSTPVNLISAVVFRCRARRDVQVSEMMLNVCHHVGKGAVWAIYHIIINIKLHYFTQNVQKTLYYHNEQYCQ